MEVNITEAELDSITKVTKEDEIIAGNNLMNSLGSSLTSALNKSTYDELSDEEITDKANETVSKIISQTEISKVKSISAYKIAEDKSYQAKLLIAELEQLNIDAELTNLEKGKQDKIVLANSKKKDAAKLVNEVVAALAIAKTLDNEVIERGSDLERVKSLQKSIRANISDKERELAEVDLNKLDKIAAASYHNESALDTESKIVNDKFLAQEEKYSYLKEDVVDLLNREIDLTESINKLNKKKAEVKKQKEIERIDAQIESLEFDIEDTQFDLKRARKKNIGGKKILYTSKSRSDYYKICYSKVEWRR